MPNDPHINQLAIAVACVNLIVVIAGIAVIWGKFSAQFAAVDITVKDLNKILHPDPGDGGDKIMTVDDCGEEQRNCQKRICAKIEELNVKIGNFGGEIVKIEKNRKEGAEKYDLRWSKIESSMTMMESFIKGSGIKV